ncbi:hypothetical protein IV500_05870 [Paeniglutamicibacter antarcticus]|uniref:Uncharacterized protein n=1 Tax=Arthrobacter terrae TaxID=2935737 RepID=A0A931CML8_9MICC|nr:hypothetical protein [Arthrobacter terrae]MBG0738950.1 hypothetical protein [Arthrobacter terrae]
MRPIKSTGTAGQAEKMGVEPVTADTSGPDNAARKTDLEAGFQFVLDHDADLLQRLADA